MNAFFGPAPAYHDFLVTANTSTNETQSKDEQSTMEIEWEQRAWPLWAWPTAGDGMEVMGSWISDCGHRGPQDLTDPNYVLGQNVTTGERTEIHPTRMVVVYRAVPSVSPKGDAVIDALISSNGTLARADENRSSGACQTPFQSCSQWSPVNDRDYDFDAAAPPKPAGATAGRLDVVDEGFDQHSDPQITTTAAGIHVHVPFKGWGKDGDAMVFAKPFLVGWDAAPPVTTTGSGSTASIGWPNSTARARASASRVRRRVLALAADLEPARRGDTPRWQGSGSSSRSPSSSRSRPVPSLLGQTVDVT